MTSLVACPVLQEEAFRHSLQANAAESTSISGTPPPLLIFVSFSLGQKALLNLARDAKVWGGVLVLRGFKDGSHKKTALALEEIIAKSGVGFSVDPELFSLFNITSVPTFVLAKPFPSQSAQTLLHDRMSGHVSLSYVLETFAKQGDLKTEAKALLKENSSKKWTLQRDVTR